MEVAEKKSERVVVEQRMALAEHWRQDWVVNAEDGTTVEELLNPAYWSHVSARMNPLDHVEVRAETGEWIVDLIVTGTGRNWATMFLAHRHDLQKIASQETPKQSVEHEVVFRGPQHKWGVKRLSDSQMIREDIPTKVEAMAWLSQYENTIQRT